jgi:hypothetical protein
LSDRLELLGRRLRQLDRMREYLAYSLEQMHLLLPITNWAALSEENHETLAAFRVRFSEFQEHLGKAMRAVAIEEEQTVEPFTGVLLYMEKLGIIDSAIAWKELRELRNAINHEYEENPQRLAAFFKEVAEAIPSLMAWHQRLGDFCAKNYGI